MLYAALTSDQKALCQSFMDSFRPIFGAFARDLEKMQVMKDFYATGVDAAINSLDAAALIGTTTGLAGAQTLAKEDIQTYMNVVSVLLANYNTDGPRQTFIKIAGISATMP